jgi:hypothetical protein
MKGHRLRKFGNNVLRRIFESKRLEIANDRDNSI